MHRFSLGRSLAVGLAAVVAAVSLLTASPIRALAETTVPYAYSVDDRGNRIFYYTIDDALEAGFNGSTIIMWKDWKLSESIALDDGQKLTIDMDGHMIDASEVNSADTDSSETTSTKYHSIFQLGKGMGGRGAQLVLTSSKTETEFEYKGFNEKTAALESYTVKTGGLLTTNGAKTRSAITAEARSRVTLDGVAVDGIYVAKGMGGKGTISLGDYASLTMQNGASVDHNYSDNNQMGTSGIWTDDSVTINMDNASISNNYCTYNGGGIYSQGDRFTLNMNNNSKVDGNSAEAGGGIYLVWTNFNIKSSDGTASIGANRARSEHTGKSRVYQSGGGIHVDQVQSQDNSGLIEGITINDNYSADEGGGAVLDQENTVLRNCTLIGNSSGCDGGAIFSNNDDNVIDNCTITGNRCNINSSPYDTNYAGGGVFVSCTDDLKLSGTCLIYGNYRGLGYGNADDLFLNENVGATAKAYVTGSLDKGSKVGVRDGISGDRMIAKSFSCPANDCFFIDLDGYYVSYGSDHDGDAWQRRATMEFDAQVNGGSIGRYQWKEQVTADGTSDDMSRVFKCWSESASTGLYPFSDFISSEKVKSPIVTFTMPQNDVNLVAEYVTRATAVTLTVDTPVPGQELAATGKLSWTDVDGEAHSKDGVAISWMKAEDGSYAPVSGEAGYGCKYAVSAAVAQDLDGDLAFALDMGERDVTVAFAGASSGTSAQAQEASVDAAGTLNLLSPTVRSASRKVASVEKAELTVVEGASLDTFKALFPQAAAVTTEDGQAATLATDMANADVRALLDDGGNVKIPDNEDHKVTIYVPLKGTADIEVPQDKVLEVEVTVTARQDVAVEAPTVDRDEGTYGEAISVTPSCATEGAAIMYSLSHSDGEGSTSQDKANERYEGTSGIALPANEGGRRTYRLKLWATLTKDGVTFESARRTYTYVIDDVRETQKVKVTVMGADTGKDPVSEKLDEYEVPVGSDFSIVAPYREGYVFEKWQAAEGVDGPMISLSDVTEDTTVTAVYNPVVSALDVTLDLPKADESLAANITKLEAKIGTSDTYVSVTDYFADDANIQWSPSDSMASHATRYAASIALDTAASGDVKYVLAQDAAVTVGGKGLRGGASVVEEDGKALLFLKCSKTDPAVYESTDELETVKLSYKQAYDAMKSQEAGNHLSDWNLPSTVEVSYVCGESEAYEISWDSITAFDKSATDEQELTATGAISFADRSSYVSHDGETETVTVKVRVAAKEAVKAPTATVEPGTYKEAQKVELACATEGATIRYTTDGTDPTEGSPVYDGVAIEVAHNATVKVRAYADGMNPSEVAVFSYKIEHAVTFDAAGGSKVDSVWVVDGEKAIEPTAPTLKGYAFDGWYTEDGEKSVEYDFSNPVTADLKLVAHWSKKDILTYAVTFDSAGGSEVSAQTVDDGKCATEPAAPTRKGYEFIGWTLDGKTYDFSTPVTADLRLVATWKAKESKKDDGDDGKGDGKDDSGKIDGDESGGGSNTSTTTEAVTASTTKKATGKELAATGDYALATVAALLTIGLAIVAAGIVVSRRKG